MTHPIEDLDFEDFLADVTGAVEVDVAEDSGCPDFHAVVARAHELAPDRIDAQAVSDVAAYAPVVSMQTLRRRRSTRDDVALSAFVAEVRAAVDVDVAETFAARAAAASPARSASSSATGAVVAMQPRSARKIWGAVLAAAAALLLVGGGVVTAVTMDGSGQASVNEAALHDGGADAEEGHAKVIDDAPSKAVAPAPAPVVEPVVEPTPDDAEALPPDADEPVATHKTPRKSLAELDALAREAFHAGRLDDARSLYLQVVARGGKGHLAELAFGDLFAIARQQKAPSTEAKLWKKYLDRFPRGAFAQDAQVGLCRRATGEPATRCWQRYLASFPDGTYAKAAERELAKTRTDAAP